MTFDLLWPGDHRAGAHLSEMGVLRAMLRVEDAWLSALVEAGIAPAAARLPPGELDLLLRPGDIAQLAESGEPGGNVVIPLLDLVRGRLADAHPESSAWLHKGLTSQDVQDTAMVLLLRDAVDAVLGEMDTQVEALVALARRHRGDVMAGRTLTQHAVPITFGLKAAQWLQGIAEARALLLEARAHARVQAGGAAGTLSAVAEMARRTRVETGALAVTRSLAERLDLAWAPPWHTTRTPLTRLADALTTAVDAWGHIAADILLGARPEIGELGEPVSEGRGGSSTMPHKANPVLSVLIRRAALTAPGLAAQMHLASASMIDERADGAWHTEWPVLQRLGRLAVTAASQTSELVSGLRVDTERMAERAAGNAEALLAERRAITGFVTEQDHGPEQSPRADRPSDYLGATEALINEVVRRARPASDRPDEGDTQ